MANITSDEFHQSGEFSPTAIADKFLRLENFQRAWEKVAENRGSAGGDRETIFSLWRKAKTLFSF